MFCFQYANIRLHTVENTNNTYKESSLTSVILPLTRETQDENQRFLCYSLTVEKREVFWATNRNQMDEEHLQLAKRHSFPYMQVYTWNILKSGSPNEVEIQSPKGDPTPVINSDGTSEEREERLEAAILWIRKELVRT